MAVFECNVPRPHASNLIFYPADYDSNNDTWGNGKPISDYDPNPEEIVDCALDTTTYQR